MIKVNCDSCGKAISSIEDGMVEWYLEGNSEMEKGFRLVHNDENCLYDQAELHRQGKKTRDTPINDFRNEIDVIKNQNAAREILNRLA